MTIQDRSSAQTAADLSVGEMLGAFRRQWWLLALCVAIGASAGAVVTSVQHDRFRAKATVYVTSRNGTALLPGRIKSYAAVATSTTTLAQVIRQLGLSTSERSLRSNVTVSIPPETDLIEISATDARADRSAKVANAVAGILGSEVESLEQPVEGRPSLVRVSTIQSAQAPDSPAFPRPKVNLAVGALAGVFIGMAASLLRDRRRASRTFRTAVAETAEREV